MTELLQPQAMNSKDSASGGRNLFSLFRVADCFFSTVRKKNKNTRK